MDDEVAFLSEVLQSGHLSCGPAPEHLSRIGRRLLAALPLTPGSPRSTTDLATLTRHMLRREAEQHGGHSPVVRAPLGLGWPDADGWARYSIVATSREGAELVLRAEPWRPSWLTGAREGSVEADAIAGMPRRVDDPVPGDPYLERLFPDVQGTVFLSRGQRQAVRAVLSIPPAGTLIVNLPTGTGKSLCAHVLAQTNMAFGEERGVTVVVVPTTALCLDQAKAVARLITHETAYHGASDDAVRREIRRRIVDGTQGIVFTSPESLLGSLRGVLFAAAARGYLRALVVDEAHIVEQWGDHFRSEFQEVAGLRRRLLSHSPNDMFRTVLLSATLSETTIRTLETLFGQPGPLAMVSAVQVRPEPSYWAGKCTVDQKPARVLEAIRHLPRPLVLYTTRVADARNLFTQLKIEGYRRLALVTGETSGAERARVIRDWSTDALDIVVATSAFGLGIDKSDVRSVVHACVPETLDRYYQEVGRGGRDGRASISLVLYTDEDLRIAREMNGKKVISVERGRQRWGQMFAAKVALGGRRFRVPVGVPPGTDPEDIDMVSQESASWNVRTLTLLARAGIIALDSEPPPQWKDGGEADGPAMEEPEELSVSDERVIEIIDPRHLEEAVWSERVQPIREQTARAQRRNLELLEGLLTGQRCAGELLQEAYTVQPRSEGGLRQRTAVAWSCGGCPSCRRQGRTPDVHSAPTPLWPWRVQTHAGERLERILGPAGILALFYPSTGTRRDTTKSLLRLLEWLVRQQIRMVIAPLPVLEELQRQGASLRSRPVFFMERMERRKPGEFPSVATTQILTLDDRLPDLSPWMDENHASERQNEPLVLVLPVETPDPERPDRRLCDVLPCRRYLLDEFLRREGL